ncbi:hypothetical protein SO802_012581 [Lithocarpus litseifolius]|uniref:RNase H type-1 domain-containing protein n=1 Tax=Lithocarpus litseifolius TaxID=425828 RepID=A0AAW2D769_9ROSI
MIKLQKRCQGQQDVLQLFQDLMGKLSTAEFELFLVQSWFIWNQRNAVVHGGILKDPRWLNKRAAEFLEEFHQVQGQLQSPEIFSASNVWFPPPELVYKLNFDAAIFLELSYSVVGAVIRNARGEVMAAMSERGPSVVDSTEAKILACRKALAFAIDAGFTDLIIEGDNENVMKLVSASGVDLSRLGHIIQDIKWFAQGLRWMSISCVKRDANSMAHSLARYAKNVVEDMYWLEDNPPPALDALYFDSLHLVE